MKKAVMPRGVRMPNQFFFPDERLLDEPWQNIFCQHLQRRGERQPSWKLLIKMANMDILIFGCLAEFQILHHHEAMHVLLSGVEV